MRPLRTGMVGCALILQCVASWAVYGVRISDLSNSPIPPNPIRVWGKVTSESPLKISDGRGEIAVTGRTATLGEFLVLDGSWNGQFFSVAPMEMIYIPAGSFLMGTPDSYASYHAEFEHPQHSVTLSGYWIGQHEVTRGEYRQFMNAGGYTNSAYWSTDGWSWKGSRTQPSLYWADSQEWGSGWFTQTDNHPVVGVSYYEAEAFCNWAGGHLPTEAQWEKAARWTGTHPNIYPWGDAWDVEKCNTFLDHQGAGGGYLKFQSAPVGSYPSDVSPYGCQDMAGNVFEWCKDWFAIGYYSQIPTGGWIDPQGPEWFDSSTWRVLRGGSWYTPDFGEGVSTRCASRFDWHPSFYSFDGGFRLAR